MVDQRSDLPSPTAEEVEYLQKLVRRIVLGQGNRFIKKLLHDKGIRIGATKPEFEANLFAAIGDGRLGRKDIEEWIDEVEGWGNQHVYLYAIPEDVADAPAWQSAETAQQEFASKGLGDLWTAAAPLDFPDEPRLSSVRYHQGVLQILWHEAASSWVREPSRDKPREEIDGWTYEFRAYRALDQRAVMRFETRFAQRLGALFLSVAVASKEHERSVEEAEALAARVFSCSDLSARRLPLSKAITALDQARVGAMAARPPVVPLKTRLRGRAGAYVEFGGAADDVGYESDADVSEVRSAIRGNQIVRFQGAEGSFEFWPPSEKGPPQPVKVRFSGANKSLRIFRRLTAAEVWYILDVVARSCPR